MTPNTYSTASLDRRGHARSNAEWVSEALADPATRFVLLSALKPMVRRDPQPSVALLAADDRLVRGRDPAGMVLLGWHRECRCLLIEAAPEETAPVDCYFEELRPLLDVLPADEAALLYCARALLFWRSRHRHCGVCGAPTEARNAGHSQRCSNPGCATEFFPRIDPAIIVLVSDGEYALLGRQAAWPKGRYSALAGFVEAGESLEDTVLREVHEETGVRVHDVKYIASQPWPFPSSLMLGFHARAARGSITLDGELEDARWYHADELRQSRVLLPSPHTIARHLIELWLRGLPSNSVTPAR
jgi:NAD+ diphosphatase